MQLEFQHIVILTFIPDVQISHQSSAFVFAKPFQHHELDTVRTEWQAMTASVTPGNMA